MNTLIFASLEVASHILNFNAVIAAKTMECDYRPLTKQATEMISDYNRYLLDHMAGKPSI